MHREEKKAGPRSGAAAAHLAPLPQSKKAMRWKHVGKKATPAQEKIK